MINLPEGVTLDQKTKEGFCECCRRHVRLRPVSLTKEWAKILQHGAERPDRLLVPDDVSKSFGKAYSYYANLQHWEFIERRGSDWYVTDLGIEFLHGQIEVPERLFIYNKHARVIPFMPKKMLGRMVNVTNIIPYEEMSREIAAAQSVPLSVTNQQKLV